MITYVDAASKEAHDGECSIQHALARVAQLRILCTTDAPLCQRLSILERQHRERPELLTQPLSH